MVKTKQQKSTMNFLDNKDTPSCKSQSGATYFHLTFQNHFLLSTHVRFAPAQAVRGWAPRGCVSRLPVLWHPWMGFGNDRDGRRWEGWGRVRPGNLVGLHLVGLLGYWCPSPRGQKAPTLGSENLSLLLPLRLRVSASSAGN